MLTCSRRGYVVRPTRANQVSSLAPYVFPCARLPGSIRLNTTQGAGWSVSKNRIVCDTTIPVLFCSTTLTLSLGTVESISRASIFNDLLFKIAVRSERLCILVTGLLDAFVTASNLRRIKSDDRPLSGVRPCIPEDVLGFQLGSNSDLKPSGYPNEKKTLHVAYLPRYHQLDSDRILWVEAVHRWRF